MLLGDTKVQLVGDTKILLFGDAKVMLLGDTKVQLVGDAKVVLWGRYKGCALGEIQKYKRAKETEDYYSDTPSHTFLSDVRSTVLHLPIRCP